MLADAVVPLRRAAIDLRGVGRALLLAADAAEQAGDARGAADLTFRAAQAAEGREDWAVARQVFARAETLARRGGDAPLAARSAAGVRRAAEEIAVQAPQETGSSARRRTSSASGS